MLERKPANQTRKCLGRTPILKINVADCLRKDSENEGGLRSVRFVKSISRPTVYCQVAKIIMISLK